ncbi:MAG: polyprenyl synthetase family protein [Proteobacteria bacterium]|nr:polyprenyl synthetase family protein [Pseudomonadota bacterium]
MPVNPVPAAAPVSLKANGIHALAPIFDLVADDFAAVNALIPRELTSDVDLVEEISQYIVESGGKRLRPLLVLLGTRCCEYSGTRQLKLAAVIEFLHTATLLHDDVVDHSSLRRGRKTANALWGNSSSVLVGDFLYSRAFQLMVDLDNMSIMAILSDATNTIAEGEVLQLANIGNTGLSEAAYMEVIRCKTALLFQAAAHTAAVLAGASADEVQALKHFGLHFGLTYQLVDDWLDYAGDTRTMGKKVGRDLAEGKLTLPLIQALKTAPERQVNLIRTSLKTKSNEHLDEILTILNGCDALHYTRNAATHQAGLAIDCLTDLRDNEYRDALTTLTRYSISRLS